MIDRLISLVCCVRGRKLTSQHCSGSWPPQWFPAVEQTHHLRKERERESALVTAHAIVQLSMVSLYTASDLRPVLWDMFRFGFLNWSRSLLKLDFNSKFIAMKSHDCKCVAKPLLWNPSGWPRCCYSVAGLSQVVAKLHLWNPRWLLRFC